MLGLRAKIGESKFEPNEIQTQNHLNADLHSVKLGTGELTHEFNSNSGYK